MGRGVGGGGFGGKIGGMESDGKVFIGVIWDFGALEDLKFSPVFLF